MKASEYIAMIQKGIERHGDQEVILVIDGLKSGRQMICDLPDVEYDDGNIVLSGGDERG